MTLILTICPNHFALCVGEQVVCSTAVEALTPVFKKSATELKLKPKLLRCKNIVNIATFNVRTLNRINQLPEMTVFAAEHNIDIICIQEHRYYYSELEISWYWKRIGICLCIWMEKLCQHFYRGCRNASSSSCLHFLKKFV